MKIYLRLLQYLKPYIWPHRLSTTRKATRIAVLVDGTIVEEGTHEGLLARDSEYSSLYTLQLLEDQEPSRRKILH